MTRVYLSLGSNIEPQKFLPPAIAALQARFARVQVSPAYRFAAVGFDGPDFCNLAVGMDTDMSAEVLNDWLHALEDRHGRKRGGPRYANRTVDIDIVLFGDLVIQGPGHLHVPRAELRHAFVLQPLAEIAGSVVHPVNGLSMAALWQACSEATGQPMTL